MLRDKMDINRLNELLASLNIWVSKSNNVYSHAELEKDTGSLYRFGWFYINGYKYSVSGWKFKDGIVTFECETTGEKIKYNIVESKVINKVFKKDTLLIGITKKIRTKISMWLKDLSDKLQP